MSQTVSSNLARGIVGLALVALLAAVVALPSKAPAASSVYVVPADSMPNPVRKPRVLQPLMTGNWAKNLDWSTWGGKTARAYGTFYQRVCKPDCASGYARKFGRAKIELSRIRTCDGRRFYTKGRAWVRKSGRWSQKSIGNPRCPY